MLRCIYALTINRRTSGLRKPRQGSRPEPVLRIQDPVPRVPRDPDEGSHQVPAPSVRSLVLRRGGMGRRPVHREKAAG